MKATIKKLPKSKIELEIEVPFQEFSLYIEKVIFNLSKDLKIEGFRQGKVSAEFIEKEIGQGKILNEALVLAIIENFNQAILENKIEAISQPEVEILKTPILNKKENSENFLLFRAKTEALPKVKIPDYRKITSTIKKQRISVKKKEIEDALSRLQKSRAKFSFKVTPAQKGDWVAIEYSSPQIKNSKKQDAAFILGEGKLDPRFEENLEGMKVGQERKFSLTFPQNHFQKELSGKKINFKVIMKSVQKIELPEINDQFAQNFGKSDLDALKIYIKVRLESEKAMAESSRIRQEILDKIIQKSQIDDIPEILVEREQNQIMENLKQNIPQELKITFEEYLTKNKKTEKELLDSFLPEAQKRIKEHLILREISQREDIEIEDKEVEEATNEMLKCVGIERLQTLDLEKFKNYTREMIKYVKTLKFLVGLTQ